MSNVFLLEGDSTVLTAMSRFYSRVENKQAGQKKKEGCVARDINTKNYYKPQPIIK
jgi:hypothetical protein